MTGDLKCLRSKRLPIIRNLAIGLVFRLLRMRFERHRL